MWINEVESKGEGGMEKKRVNYCSCERGRRRRNWGRKRAPRYNAEKEHTEGPVFRRYGSMYRGRPRSEWKSTGKAWVAFVRGNRVTTHGSIVSPPGSPTHTMPFSLLLCRPRARILDLCVAKTCEHCICEYLELRIARSIEYPFMLFPLRIYIYLLYGVFVLSHKYLRNYTTAPALCTKRNAYNWCASESATFALQVIVNYTCFLYTRRVALVQFLMTTWIDCEWKIHWVVIVNLYFSLFFTL